VRMRTLLDKEVAIRADLLRDRHRHETAELVAKAAVGRSIEATANLLGKTVAWVKRRMEEWAAIEAGGKLR
jgi:hypothetical protein